MKGTALLMNEDMTLTVLENVDVSVYKELKNEKKYDQPHCTINHKEVEFEPIHSVVWCKEDIDLDYGY